MIHENKKQKVTFSLEVTKEKVILNGLVGMQTNTLLLTDKERK